MEGNQNSQTLSAVLLRDVLRANMEKEFKENKSLSQHTGSTQVRTGAC